MPDAHAAENISLLVLDVDGVLTDGLIHIDNHGVETKTFHVRDGAGIRMWMAAGREVGIITGRSSMALSHRAAELGIQHVFQGRGLRKLDAFRELLESVGLVASQAAVIGDDLPDLSLMRLAGYPIAVSDAAPEVREAAVFVTEQPGGHGAVREAIEHLLKATGHWESVLELFGPGT